jgi:hypothetical protein
VAKEERIPTGVLEADRAYTQGEAIAEHRREQTEATIAYARKVADQAVENRKAISGGKMPDGPIPDRWKDPVVGSPLPGRPSSIKREERRDAKAQPSEQAKPKPARRARASRPRKAATRKAATRSRSRKSAARQVVETATAKPVGTTPSSVAGQEGSNKSGE